MIRAYSNLGRFTHLMAATPLTHHAGTGRQPSVCCRAETDIHLTGFCRAVSEGSGCSLWKFLDYMGIKPIFSKLRTAIYSKEVINGPLYYGTWPQIQAFLRSIAHGIKAAKIESVFSGESKPEDFKPTFIDAQKSVADKRKSLHKAYHTFGFSHSGRVTYVELVRAQVVKLLRSFNFYFALFDTERPCVAINGTRKYRARVSSQVHTSFLYVFCRKISIKEGGAFVQLRTPRHKYATQTKTGYLAKPVLFAVVAKPVRKLKECMA